MFEQLTAAERSTLASKMERAADRLDDEYEQLRDAPPTVLAAYGVGRQSGALVTDWLMAAVECGKIRYELDHMSAMETSRAAGDR